MSRLQYFVSIRNAPSWLQVLPFFFKMNLNSCSQLQNENVSFNAFHSIFNFLELGRELKHQKFNEIEVYLRNGLISLKLNFLAVRDLQ